MSYESALKTSQLRAEIFVPGQSEPLRFTNYSGVVSQHTSVPSMTTRDVTFTGTLDDDSATIILSERDDNGLTDLLLTPGFVADVPIQVTEVLVDENGVSLAVRSIFSGLVTRAVRNFERKFGQTGLVCSTDKGSTNYPLGYRCSDFCQKDLGDEFCKVVTTDFEQTAQVSAFDNLTRTATILGFLTPTDKTFSRGYLERDGLRILIREWTAANPTQFPLARPIPQSWVGSGDVLLAPGCEKTVAVCRDVYNNEINNGSVGVAMVSHDPQFQLPEEC